MKGISEMKSMSCLYLTIFWLTIYFLRDKVMSVNGSIPQVSVVIPTYNCDRYLPQAVESVLSQKRCDFELIIIDDGSTDNTQQVLRPYRDFLRYVYQNNQGVCLARNHGIKLAQGEFIAFLDADDFFLPGKLAAQLAIFDSQESLGIVHSGWQRVNAEGKLIIDVTPWQSYPELNLETWLKFKPVLPSAMMFRRQWLERISGFDPQFRVAEDVDLVLRLALAGCHAAWLQQITVCYRQHQQNAMTSGLSQAEYLTKLLDKFFQQTHIPKQIKLLENIVRYNTSVWIAWYLYESKQYLEMAEYLQQAWKYTPYLPVETVVWWVESFAEFSRSWGKNFDSEYLANLPAWQELLAWVINQ